MANEIGESVASINRRLDNSNWPSIRAKMAEGAILRIHHKISRGCLEGCTGGDSAIKGKTLSLSFVRNLEKDGVIERCGVDVYQLAHQSPLPGGMAS